MVYTSTFIRGLWITMGLLVASASDAALEFEITKGRKDALPIAIVPFAAESGGNAAPEDIAQIVSDDLARSGRFAPVNRNDLPSRPGDLGEVVFSDWRLLGTSHIVIGNIKPIPGDKFSVEFRLLDVFRGEQVKGFRVNAGAGALRRTAHQISDIVYEELTGERGAFDTRIAYVTERGRGDNRSYQLNIADSDGLGARVVLSADQPIMSPSWSPDGASIAYVSFEGRRAQVYVQNVASGKRRRISSFPGINGAPAFSPDGRRLALTLSKDGNPEIYLLGIASGRLQRITNDPAIDTEPAWSPDGQWIVFTSNRGGSPQIYRVASTGGAAQRMTFEGVYNARARYSPDGALLAFVHGVEGVFRIGVLDLANSALRVLTDTYLDEAPSFAPNGSMILYSTSTAQGSALAAVSTDGAVQQTLVERRGSAREPAWSPFRGR